MGFFRSFFGTCCGTEVFRTLRGHSWGRVLGHLLLLGILCAGFIGVGNYYMLKYRWRAAEAGFSDLFGSGINFDRNGAHPELAPEVSRRQEFPYNGLLIYVAPSGPEKEYPDETLIDRNFILLWHPACFAFMLRQGDAWVFTRCNPDTTFDLAVNPLSYGEMKGRLLETVAQKPADNWLWPEDFRKNGLSTRRLFRDFRLMFAKMKAVEYFLRQLLLTLFCTGVFAGIFRLFSRKKLPALTFGVVWKVAIYTAFPVTLVVSAFPALQLPGTHLYGELFVLGWAVYLFFVLRYLMLFPDEADGSKEDETK